MYNIDNYCWHTRHIRCKHSWQWKEAENKYRMDPASEIKHRNGCSCKFLGNIREKYQNFFGQIWCKKKEAETKKKKKTATTTATTIILLDINILPKETPKKNALIANGIVHLT